MHDPYQELIKENALLKQRIQDFEQLEAERKQMEEALKESEAKYRQLFDNAPVAIYRIDFKTGKFLNANYAFLEHIGYSQEELSSLSSYDVLTEESKKLFVERQGKVSRSEKVPETVEYKVVDKYGKQWWLHLHNKNIYDAEGHVVAFDVVAHDITEHKQVEEELNKYRKHLEELVEGRTAELEAINGQLMIKISEQKKSEEALRESESRFRDLAELLPAAVYETDEKLQLIYTNRKGFELFGYDPEDLDTGLEVFKMIAPEEQKRVMDIFMRRLQGEELGAIEYKGIKKNGSLFPILLHNVPIIKEGKLVGARGIVIDITEQKRIEEKLQESRSRLLEIINFLPDATLVIGKEGRVIAWNLAIEEMTGIKSTDIIGRGDFEYALPFYGKRMPILVDEALRSQKQIDRGHSAIPVRGNLFLNEGEVRMSKGEARFLSERAAAIYGIDGEVVGAIESIRDVTEQKMLEKAFAGEHEKLSSILDGSPVSTFVIDSNRRVTEWNIANEFFMGLSKGSMIGKPIDLKPFFKDKAPPTLAELILKLSDEEIIKGYADKGVRKSVIHPEAFETMGSIWIKGKEHVMAIQATRIRDATGNVIGAIQCAEDITEQRQAQEALRESEELYRTALESSNDGVMILQDGRYVYLNQKFLDTLGRSRDEMIGKAMGGYIHPDDLITVLDYYGKYQKGLSIPNHFEVRVFKPDGAFLYADVSPVEVTYKGKKSILAYVRDITDRKRTEEEQLRVNKLESVGTLAGGIAHDFNNLLAAIQGYIELVKMDIPPGNKVHDRLMAAEKSVNQAAELTNRLITFAKGGEPIRKVSDIGDMVKDAVLKSIGTSPMEKRFHLGRDLWHAEVDEGQIQQVIRNLAINALEAMPEGGRLTIRAENTTVKTQDRLPLNQGDYIRISMEDTGTGIPKDELPLIFDPYFSTKQRGGKKGMGLGLSVCHSVVSKHNGYITVESEEGKGSTFHVYLPAVVSEAPLIKEWSPDERPDAKGRILVMDDEAMIRDMLMELLMAMGYNVETANDGLAAIDLYIKAGESRQPYKMVILDLTVPGGLGGKLTMERLLEIDHDVKGIILSGYTDDPVIQNYPQYGFLGALTKPFTLKALQNILEKYL